jgi:hypothetical protein
MISFSKKKRKENKRMDRNCKPDFSRQQFVSVVMRIAAFFFILEREVLPALIGEAR